MKKQKHFYISVGILSLFIHFNTEKMRTRIKPNFLLQNENDGKKNAKPLEWITKFTIYTDVNVNNIWFNRGDNAKSSVYYGLRMYDVPIGLYRKFIYDDIFRNDGMNMISSIAVMITRQR